VELRFDHAPERGYYALRFRPGSFESAPFIRELRFWGVDRAPCPQLGTLAALIALKGHPLNAVTLAGAGLTPSVCTALQAHFGVEIHPAKYEIDRRELAGGQKTVAPVRFGTLHGRVWSAEPVEVLAWISLDDFEGPFGGELRTNIDAFDLTEAEKNLIVALCCGGKEVGQIVLDAPDPAWGPVLHRIGLGLAPPPGT